jgi:TPR repeat protein
MKISCCLFAALSLFSSHSVFADYEAGITAAQNGDFETAFNEFTIAAEDGLAIAQFNLAILYFSGQGVEQNVDQAFKWTAAAAEQGHITAQFNLGALYYEGQGTRRDRETAFQWYEKAANADHAPAQFNLAEMYYLGNGVKKDPIYAHAWISRAIENDYTAGQDLLEDIEDDLNSDQLREARRLFARMKIGL